MDKWLKSPWIIRVVALLFAVLLYAYVNAEADSNNRAGSIPSTSSNETNVVEADVGIRIDDTQYVVSGVPETVSMQLVGPASDVAAAVQQKNYQAYVDLTDLGVGEHQVTLQYENVSDNIQVYMEPASIDVTIEEKASQQFDINVGYTNEDAISPGYQVDSSTVDPQTVSIVSTEEIIDQIAGVYAYVDLTDVDGDISRKEVPVKVYDAQGNELSVNIEPTTVEVSVEVSNPSKSVPVEVRTTGEPPDDVNIASLTPSEQEVTIYASQDTLDGIDAISTEEIDLSDVTENQSIDAALDLPDGVRLASSEEVEVDVELEESSETTIEDIPIETSNLPDGLTASFTDPESGEVTLTVSGLQEDIENLEAGDFTAAIDLDGLEAGEQTVPITVTGPDNVEITPDTEEATVELTEENTDAAQSESEADTEDQTDEQS